MASFSASRLKRAGRPYINNSADLLPYENMSAQPRAFPMWLLLTGILLIPAGLDIHLSGDGLKFTPGRAIITLLLLPSLSTLARPSRHLIASDFFVLLTALWMVGSRIPADGLNQSAIASALELFGGYFVGRSYFYGPLALTAFLKIFKVVIFLVIVIAILDPLFGENVAQTLVASLVHTPGGVPNQDRFGIIRAASTIEMAELYGTVCCVAGSIFLYMETRKGAKFFWAGFAFFGCILSLSSGPLLAFIIVLLFFVYDHLLHDYTWRWKLAALALTTFLLSVFVLTNRPISWLVAHMTLDPSTAYFRLYVFDYMLEQVKLSPFVGYGFGGIGDDDFLSTTTVDCVWLVNAARYGIPMIAFFLCANLMTFISFPFKGRSNRIDEFMTKAGTGFTQTIVTLMVVGITVHFWNATWMLWAVCLGIRGAIKEWHCYGGRRTAQNSRFGARHGKFAAVGAKEQDPRRAQRYQ